MGTVTHIVTSISPRLYTRPVILTHHSITRLFNYLSATGSFIPLRTFAKSFSDSISIQETTSSILTRIYCTRHHVWNESLSIRPLALSYWIRYYLFSVSVPYLPAQVLPVNPSGHLQRVSPFPFPFTKQVPPLLQGFTVQGSMSEMRMVSTLVYLLPQFNNDLVSLLSSSVGRASGL